MNWFEKLNKYFPIEEMKSKQHFDLLLQEKGDIYHKDEGPNHIVMYAEFDTFVFIDYLFVSSKVRGQGIGEKLINKFKEKNKPIILEVEPVDYEDSDTEKRLRFYKRMAFKHAKSIGYSPYSLATNKETKLEILYWSPDDSSEELIYQQMKSIYKSIHTYKDEEVYGQSYQSVDKVLRFIKEQTETDLLQDIAVTK